MISARIRYDRDAPYRRVDGVMRRVFDRAFFRVAESAAQDRRYAAPVKVRKRGHCGSFTHRAGAATIVSSPAPV